MSLQNSILGAVPTVWHGRRPLRSEALVREQAVPLGRSSELQTPVAALNHLRDAAFVGDASALEKHGASRQRNRELGVVRHDELGLGQRAEKARQIALRGRIEISC